MGSCTADCGSLFRCTAVGEADVAEKEIYHTGSKEHQSLLLRSIQEKWFKEIRRVCHKSMTHPFSIYEST